jgi:uncharacterized membrane protein YphA (DoxX/SURF4 family)
MYIQIRNRLDHLLALLKITYGLLFIVVGLDKFTNFITNWEKYINLDLLNTMNISLKTFLSAVGIFEIAIGILIVSPLTRIGAYMAVAWLGIMVINLISLKTYYDIAVLDVVIAIGLVALAKICKIRNILRIEDHDNGVDHPRSFHKKHHNHHNNQNKTHIH